MWIGMVVLGACDRSVPAEPALTFDVRTSPTTTTCLPSADLTFIGAVPAAFAGRSARLEFGAQALATGVVGPAAGGEAPLTLTVPWVPARGPIRGELVVGEARVGVSLEPTVLGPAVPELLAFGVWDGAGWVTPVGDLVVGDEVFAAGAGDPRGLAGAPSTLELIACAEDGLDCAPLASAADPTFGEVGARVPLDALASEVCAALPERPRVLLRAVARNACGEIRSDLVIRPVTGDCDADGVPRAHDCDDTAPGLGPPGSVSADGVAVPDLASAVGASEILVCGGSHAGGLVFDGDVAVRSVGGQATLLAPVTGSTVRIDAGDARLEGLRVEPGPGSLADGELGGGALNAWGASRLTLVDVDLQGGAVVRGGALIGPTNGALDAFGGAWTGGSATEGGVAWLAGGRIEGVAVTGGVAAAGGGGIASVGGDLLLVDVDIASNQAARGGGLYVAGGSATLTGVELVGNSAVDGGCVQGDFPSGGLIDLRPSIVDLDPTRFQDCTATGRGGALGLVGGSLVSVLWVGRDSAALEGGFVALDGASWDDAAGDLSGGSASAGTAVWASGSELVVLGSIWDGDSGGTGGLFLTGSSMADLQNTSLTGFSCGLRMDAGTASLAGVTGINASGDVCGADWQAAFGVSACDASGCFW